MKVVLDTNVIVAAFATQGLCHALFELCIDQHQIIISHEILREVEAALQKKLKVPPSVIKDTTDYLMDHASVRRPKRLAEQISRDPSDDHILALAQLSQADYIITGDEDLLVLKTYANTPIVLPRQFWEILKTRERQPK
jgi:putative PIN family toxin of toxin-antitoxin system